jgi:hypothetical protein
LAAAAVLKRDGIDDAIAGKDDSTRLIVRRRCEIVVLRYFTGFVSRTRGVLTNVMIRDPMR